MDFKKYNINNIDEFFKFCNSEIEYGWIDEKGQRYYGIKAKGYYDNCRSGERIIV